MDWFASSQCLKTGLEQVIPLQFGQGTLLSSPVHPTMRLEASRGRDKAPNELLACETSPGRETACFLLERCWGVGNSQVSSTVDEPQTTGDTKTKSNVHRHSHLL